MFSPVKPLLFDSAVSCNRIKKKSTSFRLTKNWLSFREPARRLIKSVENHPNDNLWRKRWQEETNRAWYRQARNVRGNEGKDFYEGIWMGRSANGVFDCWNWKTVGAARASLAGAYLMRSQTVGSVNCALLLLWIQRIEQPFKTGVKKSGRRTKIGEQEREDQGIDF